MEEKILVLDIETDALNANTIYVCVTKDLQTGDVSFYREPDKLLVELKKYDYYVGHNILSFDAPILNKLWGTALPINKIRDTLVLSQLFNPDREGKHSLAALAPLVGMTKIDFNDFSGFSEEMLEYCKMDVEITSALYTYLMEKERQDFSYKSIILEHKIRHVINRQQSRGFYLDVRKAHTVMAKIKQEANQIEYDILTQVPLKPKLVKEVTPRIKKDGTLSSVGLQKIENVVGAFSIVEFQKFNLGSPKQIIDRLNQYGWKPTQFTPKGSPKITEINLETISDKAPEALQKLSQWKMLTTRAKTIEAWLDEVDDTCRVHGDVYTMGAVTGRMTHRNPNMANIVANDKPYGYEFRSCWTVPNDDYVLVGMDAKGLELRMLANYMKDDAYSHEVVNGDPHAYNQKLAGLPTRADAKTFIYAFNYGASDKKLGAIINGSVQQGSQLRKKFLSNVPKLANLIRNVERAAKRGYVRGIDGRRLMIRQQRKALNSLLQGAGAICCKQWSIFLDEEIMKRKLDAYLVNTIHDEQQYEVRKDQAEELVSLADPCISKVSDFFNMHIQLNADAKVGMSWAETH